MNTAQILISLPDLRGMRENIEGRTNSPVESTEVTSVEESATSTAIQATTIPEGGDPSGELRATRGWASAAWHMLVGGLLICLFIVSYLAIANGRRSNEATEVIDAKFFDLSPESLRVAPQSAEMAATHQAVETQTASKDDPLQLPVSTDQSTTDKGTAANDLTEAEESSLPDEVAMGAEASNLAPLENIDSFQNADRSDHPLDTARNGYTYPMTDPRTYLYPDSSVGRGDSSIRTGQRRPAPTDGALLQPRAVNQEGVASLKGTIELPSTGIRR